MGGNCEDTRVPPLEIIDMKPYIYESAEERILTMMNNHYLGRLRDPMFGTITTYGGNEVNGAMAAFVKCYCDTEPT